MKETTVAFQPTAKAESAARWKKRRPFRVIWKRHWRLYLMMLPGFALAAVFNYYPMWGIAMAFLDYNPVAGIRGSEFVGLDQFRRFLTTPSFPRLLRNTLVIAIGKIVAGQLAALIFALTLNEIGSRLYKRAMQTFTTLPHFLSWTIIGGMMIITLTSTGQVNRAIIGLGLPPIRFLGDARVFPWTLILSETWKGFGWGAVIYLAALTAINPELYEAAVVDGAGRWARLRHVTLPGISPTIVLMSCLSLAGILSAGFEQILLLSNPVVYTTGDVLDTYVYRVGLLGAEWSLGTAVGLFRGVLGFILILLSWYLADRLANYRIF